MSGSEREFIRWLEQRTGPPQWPVVVGIGDDMAVVEIGADRPAGGAPVLLTSDMLLDGVHFRTGTDTWEQIGRKAIACSLSDCAAMAVRPVAATVSVAWPRGSNSEAMKRLFDGMWEISQAFSCSIVGGDTTSWDSPLAIDVSILAAQYQDQGVIRRSGARPGDTLYVTGSLGGSRLGRHLTFRPRVQEAEAIARELGRHLHAMMDISDGLSIDLHRMGEASNVGAELVEDLVAAVISDDARRASAEDGVPALEHALNDGEDFELLLAVDGNTPELPENAEVTLHPVGKVTEPDTGILLKNHQGQVRPLPPAGFEHLP